MTVGDLLKKLEGIEPSLAVYIEDDQEEVTLDLAVIAPAVKWHATETPVRLILRGGDFILAGERPL